MYASIGSAVGSGSSDGQQIKVIEGYLHPLYNRSAHLYDIGILKLERGVATETLDLCADGSDNEVGQIATVGEWRLTENGSQSLLLQNVDVQIISNVECNKQYNNRITEGMLCAGGGNGKDSCSGDSGGPLIANSVLVGIVSWGGRCGVTSGVYTRVSYVQDYINDILSGGNESTFASDSAAQRSVTTNETSAVTLKAFASKTPVIASATITLAPTTQSEVATTDVSTGKTESSAGQYAPSTDPNENATELTKQLEMNSNHTNQKASTTTASSTSRPLDLEQEGSVHPDELRVKSCT